MSQHEVTPNVTPFLDILLVLLIVFMVAVQARTTLDVQLPDPAAQVRDAAGPIALEVGPRGRFAINQQPVEPGSLASRLRSIFASRSDKTLLVRGARTATYQEVMTAMDVAKGAGVLVLGADTTPPRW